MRTWIVMLALAALAALGAGCETADYGPDGYALTAGDVLGGGETAQEVDPCAPEDMTCHPLPEDWRERH